ncbi:magnesium transporter [Ruminococcaceae bacterium OttesenSCG-928-I18]|nr:magnesium transporter [Ruminococcaceae bacterium OttesenSCG-928-I18]
MMRKGVILLAKKVNEAKLGLLTGQRNYRALRAALAELNDIDVAHFLEDLPEEQQPLVFRTLEKDQAMEVFAELEAETQQRIIERITDRELSALMEDLSVDDAVDMLEEMPATLVKRVLQNASPETRVLINQFLRYPENSAGSIMTAEFTDLRRTMTVEDAIKRIRRVGEDRETIYTCYVMDDQRHLDGVVTVKDLLLAQDGEKVEDLMEPDVISVQTTSDQEAAVRLMAEYGLISLPVVDRENRLVGIVTVDDAVDVLQEEATEDFEKMAAMVPSDKPYLKSGVLSLAKNRILWLLILMVSSMLTGAILGRYEAAFEVIPLLVTFIPMLTGTGGNAGSQSSAMVIRGMSLGEIHSRDLGAVLFKEVRVSLMVAVPLALVNYLRILIMYEDSAMVGLVVSLAMVCTVTLANSLGGILPILAKLLRIDPALMAAPLITTIVDACSLLIYFGIAVSLLPL